MCRQSSSSSYIYLIQHIKQLKQGTFLPLIQLQLELKWLSATQFSVQIIGNQADVVEISSLSGEPFKCIFKNFLYLYIWKKTQIFVLKVILSANMTGISSTVTRKRISWKQYGKIQWRHKKRAILHQDSHVFYMSHTVQFALFSYSNQILS